MAKITELRPAMSTLTYAATQKQLRDNGYAPCSAYWPYGVGLDVYPAIVASPPASMIAEHPPAVLTYSREGGRVAALIVCDARYGDEELEARARGVLDSRGLLSGPHRVDAECVTYLLRCSAYEALETRGALSGAIDLIAGWRAGPGAPLMPYVIPLTGEWQNGSPLTVPYADLAELSDPEALIQDLDRLAFVLAEERKPPPKPAKAGWLGMG